MRATPEKTESWHNRHPGLYHTTLGRTELHVSGAGFGSYRVSSGVEGHRLALRRAILSGINLIDTSTNYADGASEELIGEVFSELIREGAVARNEIVVVTKAGYIQGANYRLVQDRLADGSGFPDVVEYGPGLWHCIAPEFLADQITRSLARLGLTTLDVLLLHNPEYYLGWASQNNLPIEDARREYYRRIRAAFTYLETEVESGRIAHYGISSNSFPDAAESYDHTSLAEVIRIAQSISLVNHFSVIQFPANLYERGFVRERNQPEGETLIGLASRNSLGVLINRPLNAIVDDQLIRLADFQTGSHEVTEQEIREQIEKIHSAEGSLLARLRAELEVEEGVLRAFTEFMALGATMKEHWDSFGSIEHFNDVVSQLFAPRLGYMGQYVREHGTEGHATAYTSYLQEVRALIHAVSTYYSLDAQRRSNQLKKAAGLSLGSEPIGTLSSLAIRLLLGVPGVSSVLVGMRREEYVDDVITALKGGPLGSEETFVGIQLPTVTT